MAVTMVSVRALLDVDEPKYAEAAELGPEAIPHLETLVREGDPMLASKATYLASLIQSDQSIEVVKAAAKSADAVVRVAAAAAARNLPAEAAEEVLAPLMADNDAGVQKTASKVAAPGHTSAPAQSPAGGPAPPESGGGSVAGAGYVQGAESPVDTAGSGGGSTDRAGDGAVFSGGDGGGTVDGSVPGAPMVGEGGGSV
jgi:hypothetical protein